MDRIYKFANLNPDAFILYLPESFEWIILSSEIIKDAEIDEMLKSTADFADSILYASWEQFFTDLLSEKMAGTYLKYSKSSLNPVYLQKNNIEKIKKVIEGK